MHLSSKICTFQVLITTLSTKFTDSFHVWTTFIDLYLNTFQTLIKICVKSVWRKLNEPINLDNGRRWLLHCWCKNYGLAFIQSIRITQRDRTSLCSQVVIELWRWRCGNEKHKVAAERFCIYKVESSLWAPDKAGRILYWSLTNKIMCVDWSVWVKKGTSASLLLARQWK